MNNHLSFLTESSKNFVETPTIGGFSAGSSKNTFDAVFEQAYHNLMEKNIDPMLDVNTIIQNQPIYESYKETLLSQLKDDCDAMADRADGTRYATLYEQTEALLDNCVADMIQESTRVGQLLPIKTVDFPVLIKQNLALATKDIIQTEVTKSPVIKKHIERRWVVDPKTGKRWEYPQCFFKDEFMEIYNAGKGLPIKDTAVNIKNGTCFNYNIPAKLTDSADPTREHITFDLKIVSANVTFDDGAKDIPLEMRINMSDGTWLGGQIKDKDGNIVDVITGTVDFLTNNVCLSSAAGKVNSVKFGGYLSNEANERTVTWDRTREEHEWKIEDGFRVDVPYSLEELEDTKALMDMDLYKLTYNDLSDILVQMEDSQILKYLDEQYDKYKGVELDPLGFNPFIREQEFDCDSKTQTVALQSEYIQKMLKFWIDRFVIDICDSAKIEDMTFVCYGNPRYISLLDPEVNWVVKSGDSVGGVKANYSYGIMNAAGMKIQVVSTYKYSNRDTRKLRFIPYPLNDSQFTFKHYKYTTHILTAQNSGYRSSTLPGGSMTYLMGTTRNTTCTIQGIQGSMSFKNTPFILDK
jgi:hypothetical protein